MVWASTHRGPTPGVAAVCREVAKPWHEMDPAGDRLTYGFNPEVAVWIDQLAAVQHHQRTNVLWPDFVRPQHEPVFCGQPFHRHHPGSALAPRGSLARDLRLAVQGQSAQSWARLAALSNGAAFTGPV